MGSLMKKGHKVMVYDVNKSATNALANEGASIAGSLAEVGEKCHNFYHATYT